MTAITGLRGLRPHPEHVADVTAPPYDVIKPGTELEALLQNNDKSVYHVTLGPDAPGALKALLENESLIEDNDGAYYVYEQSYGDNLKRLGFFAATAVSDYSEHQVIRHEKTFDDKVKGRIALAQSIGHTTGPVFFLTKSAVTPILNAICDSEEPLYQFTSDFNGLSELHGIQNRVFRVSQDSEHGKQLQSLIAENPLYIADGHHRYHAALKNEQSHLLSYIVEDAKILAYNRVINGTHSFDSIKDKLNIKACDNFHTPEKHQFCIYTKNGSYLIDAIDVPEDVVGRLDCSILEREVYPHLGLNHSMIVDPKHFDYYAESELEAMQASVDKGDYDIAVALHPVSIDELMAVADAGLENSDIVMPEKSTFFAPKILTGLFINKNNLD